MDKRSIRIFFTVFFTIYGAINYYIFIRGYQGLEYVASLRIPYLIVFILVISSYFIARAIERKKINALSSFLFKVGSWWFGFLLYFFLGIVLLDLLRFVNNLTGIVSFNTESYPFIKFIVTAALTGSITLALILGHLNAIRLKVKTLHLTIDKPNAVTSELNIVMASDIHLGTMVGRKRTLEIVNAINALQPDIVLLPGDIVDSEIPPVVYLDLGAVLKDLKSTYGVYGVTGNHEYIGGVDEAVAYIREHKIDLLRDEVRSVAGITIVGREDYTIKHRRKSISELLQGVDTTQPIVLMDHQPFHLEEAEAAGVDFQVSGHTHRGQLWPLNYVTKRVYEKDWGYLRKGMTHIYVSSGAGTWGPPVKIGNDAEIVQFILHFKG